MKKIVFLQWAVILLALSSIFAAAQTSTSNMSNTPNASALNGAWQRVYYHNGKTTITGELKEFVVIHDGFFSSVGQDSSGRWNNTHVGSFEIDNNIMKNKLLYSSHPQRVGAHHWVEYEVKGDTLTMKWFKKFITPQGQDMTAQMPKAVSEYIKAKQ